MRNLFELFDEIVCQMNDLGIDAQALLEDDAEAREKAMQIRVCAAHQPAWPLAETISHFYFESNDEEYEEDEEFEEGDMLEEEENSKQESIFWIVLGGHPYDMSPYAPNKCFNR